MSQQVKTQMGPKLVYQEAEVPEPRNKDAKDGQSTNKADSTGKLINNSPSSRKDYRKDNYTSVQTIKGGSVATEANLITKPDYDVMSLPEVGKKPGRNGKVPQSPADQSCCNCRCTIF